MKSCAPERCGATPRHRVNQRVSPSDILSRTISTTARHPAKTESDIGAQIIGVKLLIGIIDDDPFRGEQPENQPGNVDFPNRPLG
jgi:hypothetical protein